MRIFANHAHVMPEAVNPQATVDSLLRFMEACGLERVVCFAPFARQAEEADIPDPNLWLAEQIEDREELFGFATFNPARPESLAALERVPELGLLGLKLHPAFDKFNVTDPRAWEFYAAATELGLPLDFHTGVHASRLRDSEMLKFDDLAWKVPQARLIIEHLGTLPFYYQALGIIGNNNYKEKRLFAGITSVMNPEVRLWYLGPKRVQETAHLLGAEVMIYGLDFPYNSVEVIQRELEIFQTLDLGPGGQEALLGGNLARLLGIEWD